jgi:hypothetical protein
MYVCMYVGGDEVAEEQVEEKPEEEEPVELAEKVEVEEEQPEEEAHLPGGKCACGLDRAASGACGRGWAQAQRAQAQRRSPKEVEAELKALEHASRMEAISKEVEEEKEKAEETVVEEEERAEEKKRKVQFGIRRFFGSPKAKAKARPVLEDVVGGRPMKRQRRETVPRSAEADEEARQALEEPLPEREEGPTPEKLKRVLELRAELKELYGSDGAKAGSLGGRPRVHAFDLRNVKGKSHSLEPGVARSQEEGHQRPCRLRNLQVPDGSKSPVCR